ncbi:UPF0061 protein YdiU [hydrothermal vent metagenome]|uniref:UPF0061 protein YdiU n=1 Tax=hydrothermal vent metagenome TaxID=652676 RepID=A0A3B0ZCD1_9ZZZZ
MHSILKPGHSRVASLESLAFENRYAKLPAPFFHGVSPTPLKGAHLASFNAELGALFGLTIEDASQQGFVDYFSGARDIPGAEPLAMVYAGHQFGHFVPQLGDGRAMLLGQVRDDHGVLWDMHLKGSGPTRFSRGSDGRAVLRSSIREYLCSEAMFGLGIPTTRALCLISSSESVVRERIEPGAMLVRMAQSHVRFGSLEYFYHRGDHGNLRKLGEYLLQQEFAHLRDEEEPYLALFDEVIRRTAKLVAQWQGVGFCHGVMNSDNMSILGLTLDYGPFAFMDTFEHDYICNHSDHQGRYAYHRQPEMAHFNLACLATALLPLVNDNSEIAITLVRERLANYWTYFNDAHLEIVRAKLGFLQQESADLELWNELLLLMEGEVDFTLFFRQLGALPLSSPTYHPLRSEFIDLPRFDLWMYEYRQRLQREHSCDTSRRQSMNSINPKYILRNYMAEAAIRAAEDDGDYSEIDRLLILLRTPFSEQPESQQYAQPAPAWAQSIQLSCSS